MFTARPLLHLLVSGLCLVGGAYAKPPKAPSLEFLYNCNATLLPAIEVGLGPHGTRNVIPIAGGSFSGPKLNGKYLSLTLTLAFSKRANWNFYRAGTILNLGADWGLVDNQGVFSADTRYQLHTSDGADIYIRTSGPAQPDGTLQLRVIFETGSKKYWWLNNVVAIGVLTVGNGWVDINVWQLAVAT
jgi:hypothetical protein